MRAPILVGLRPRLRHGTQANPLDEVNSSSWEPTDQHSSDLELSNRQQSSHRRRRSRLVWAEVDTSRALLHGHEVSGSKPQFSRTRALRAGASRDASTDLATSALIARLLLTGEGPRDQSVARETTAARRVQRDQRKPLPALDATKAQSYSKNLFSRSRL
jgi:hypothetical protein